MFTTCMKVLMLGTYDLDRQPKSLSIRDGLRKNGVHVDVVTDQSAWKYLKLAKALLTREYDVVFATGHFVLLLTKMLSRKPVLYDIFISAHDTLVLDRKKFKEGSLPAKLIFFMDKMTCRLADAVTIDTQAYADYFVEQYGLEEDKVHVLYLGAYDKRFHPQDAKHFKEFTVEYHGGFIPVHGTEYMIRAAQHTDAHFIMMGKGQEREEMVALAEELGVVIDFPGFVSDKKLAENIARSHVCLGMFGTTEKNPRTISNKVFEYMAMKKAFITGDTPATREILEDGKHCLLVEPGNPKAIAEAIEKLKDVKLRKNLEKNAHNYYQKNFTVDHTGKRAKEILHYTLRQ